MQARAPGRQKGGGRDKKAPRKQEIAGKAFAASGRTYPNGQGIETLTDTHNSDSSESYQSEDGPPGLLPADQVEAEAGEETGTTPGHDSKSGGSDNDEGEPSHHRATQAEDPETIREAGNEPPTDDQVEEDLIVTGAQTC